MQLFNLLKSAQEKGPNESDKPNALGNEQAVKRDNQTENKEEEYIEQTRNDSKMDRTYYRVNSNGDMIAHMRIDEVEDENAEHTEDQAFDHEDATEAWERNRNDLEVQD